MLFALVLCIVYSRLLNFSSAVKAPNDLNMLFLHNVDGDVLSLRKDANCCEQMHFPTEMCPLPYTNQCTFDATHSRVIVFIAASLDEYQIRETASFCVHLYGGEIRRSRLRAMLNMTFAACALPCSKR